jgi:ribosomal-protein-alanine N-acetyltransferase
MALPVIHTKRLVLRPWTHQDVDALHALWTAPGVRRYLWDDVIIPRSTVQEIVDSHLATAEHQAIGYWTLHLPDPPIAGFCGFRPIDGGPEIELLYALDPQHWGKGLATEA